MELGFQIQGLALDLFVNHGLAALILNFRVSNSARRTNSSIRQRVRKKAGKLAVVMGDDDSLSRKETDRVLAFIKNVTGGGLTKINKKFQHKYTARLCCRFTLAMNELPPFTDNTKSLIPRTLVLSFDNSYKIVME